MTRRAHPLLTAFHAADSAWQAEIEAEAKRLRVWPGDFRYSREAEALPSYPARRDACWAWHRAGRPLIADPIEEPIA